MGLQRLMAGCVLVGCMLIGADAIAQDKAGSADSWKRHSLAGLSFEAPPNSEVTEQALKSGVTVIAVTRGDEILIVTVYSGKKAPGVLKARAVHIEEVEKKVARDGKPTFGKERIRMFKRNRDIWTMTHGPEARQRKVRVLALQRAKLTVVATWTTPAGMTPSKGFVRTLLEGLSMG